MILIGGALLSFVLAMVLWRGSTDMFARPMFTRRNYRDVELPTAVGILIPMATFAVSAAVVLLGSIGPDAPGPAQSSLTLTAMAASGFSLIGLLDDLAVDVGSSGYRGHVRALLRGRLTAGSMKMLAGPAVAVVVVHPVVGASTTRLLLDGALVALAANLANLFDRAPGRVTKVSILCTAALVIAAACSVGVPYATLGALVVVAAAVGLLGGDLGERLMLGDAGANPLGAAVGLGVVLTMSTTVRTGVLLVLVALNLASERVSFSSVIASVAPLRWIDELGRRRSPPPG